MELSFIKTDQYVWGQEQILWGFDPAHQYTLKVLEPKPGKAGCLSLQYHKEKSESWLVLSGAAWILMVVEGKVCTRIMRRGDLQNIPTGTIHRIAAASSDLKVLEPSTPDRHAADKTVVKDVIRLHCFHGREVSAPGDESQKQIVNDCVTVSQTAMDSIAAGNTPEEFNPELLLKLGGTKGIF